jgi:hypothetical protein
MARFAGSLTAKLEMNTVMLNRKGFTIDKAGADLGGGALGSTGGNVMSCNTFADLHVEVAVAVSAIGNRWDHAPPSGNDVILAVGASAGYAGATLAASPCP